MGHKESKGWRLEAGSSRLRLARRGTAEAMPTRPVPRRDSQCPLKQRCTTNVHQCAELLSLFQDLSDRSSATQDLP